MKIRKNAEQQNFLVDVDYYKYSQSTWEEFEKRVKYGYVDVLNGQYVVYADDCEEIKVVYSKQSGEYKTRVTRKNGIKVMVNL